MKMHNLILALLLSGASLATAAPNRPNVLWILGDDLGTELGCYGNPDARTPQLDQLAKQGVRYTRFYTTAPVCSASRSAFITGMYAQTLHAQDHRTQQQNKKPLPDGVRLITHWFKDAGYATANLVDFPAALGIKASGKDDWNFTFPGQAYTTKSWADLPGGKPFFALINFSEPHRSFTVKAKADPAKVKVPAFYPDAPAIRADWAAYIDEIGELDRKVGLVLKQLAADGLADDTIVVFFGDNGRCHVRDKQFCYEEGLHVPLIIRWPKNFPDPSGGAPGRVDDRMIAAIDLAPTMLAVAGLDVPPAMQGRVFTGPKAAPARDYVFGGRDRCDETKLTLRTVRDSRYRYILNLTPGKSLMSPNAYKLKSYPAWKLLLDLAEQGKVTPAQALFTGPTAPEEELYDLQNDPDQLVNLAGKPAVANELTRLRGKLRQWRMEIGELN